MVSTSKFVTGLAFISPFPSSSLFFLSFLFFLFFSFPILSFTHTCTDCFSSVRSASIVPCRWREGVGYDEKRMQPIFSLGAPSAAVLSWMVFSTQTHVAHTSLSLSVSTNPLLSRFLSVPLPLVLSFSVCLPLSLSLFLSPSLPCTPF